MSLAERTALVTGGTRGIGRAIAEHLAAEGAAVAVCDTSRERLEEMKQQGFMAYEADVSQPDDVEQMVQALVKERGRIDILVNNAGITRDALLMRMTDEEWSQVLQTDLDGVFLVCRACIRPMLKQRQGRIVNISSIIGVTGNAGQTNYAAAKAGVIGFSKALAREVASRNLLVNVVAPGYIDTAMTRVLSEDHKQALQKQIPLGRTGTPEDVAAAVGFLVSEANQYITGQTIHVDGGLVI